MRSVFSEFARSSLPAPDREFGGFAEGRTPRAARRPGRSLRNTLSKHACPAKHAILLSRRCENLFRTIFRPGPIHIANCTSLQSAAVREIQISSQKLRLRITCSKPSATANSNVFGGRTFFFSCLITCAHSSASRRQENRFERSLVNGRNGQPRPLRSHGKMTFSSIACAAKRAGARRR